LEPLPLNLKLLYDHSMLAECADALALREWLSWARLGQDRAGKHSKRDLVRDTEKPEQLDVPFKRMIFNQPDPV
jgi:hypothetical protein